MKKFVQMLALLLAFSVLSPLAMAKDDNPSSKAKSSEVKKAKAKKEKKEKKKKEKKSKSSKKEKAGTSKGSEKSAKKGNASTSTKKSASSSKSSKRSTKSGLTGTDKAKQFKSVTVNLNKADAATLAYYLVGIGETRAKAIIKYRKKNGKFKSTEDLMQVPGIGEAIYAGLRKNVSTSRGESSVPKKTSGTGKK